MQAQQYSVSAEDVTGSKKELTRTGIEPATL